MKNLPLITIGITCFNAEETIARAIASAEAQDYPNFEIIVVDDCSSDGSVEVVKKIAKKDKRITLHRHKKNGGLAVALNTIISKAKGKYIVFFDDDDESHPSRISKQYKRLTEFEAKHPTKPILCYANRKVLVNGIETRRLPAIGRRSPEPHGTMIADFLLFRREQKGHVFGEFGTLCTFASKKTLKEFGFDPTFRRAQDRDLAIRVGMAGGYCISVNEYLIFQHLTEAPEKSSTIPLDYLLRNVRKNKEYLQKQHAYWGAIFFNCARSYRTLQNPVKCGFYLLLACLVSPKVFASVLRRLASMMARSEE